MMEEVLIENEFDWENFKKTSFDEFRVGIVMGGIC